MQNTRTDNAIEEVSLKRSITPFVLEHMAVDYCLDRLDNQSRVEFEKRILNDPELKHKCEMIEASVNYCSALGERRITSESLYELTEDLGLHKIMAYYRRIRPKLILAVTLMSSFVLSLLIYKLIKMFL